ncbi:unnamed protein product, partial [Prorocentrum cordatum]
VHRAATLQAAAMAELDPTVQQAAVCADEREDGSLRAELTGPPVLETPVLAELARLPRHRDAMGRGLSLLLSAGGSLAAAARLGAHGAGASRRRLARTVGCLRLARPAKPCRAAGPSPAGADTAYLLAPASRSR